MIMYGAEVFLHFQAIQNERSPPPPPPSVNPARNRPISHPVTMDVNNPYPPPYKDIVVDVGTGGTSGSEGGGGGGGGVYATDDTTFH